MSLYVDRAIIMLHRMVNEMYRKNIELARVTKCATYTDFHEIENCDCAYSVCCYDENIQPAVFLLKDGICGNSAYAFALGLNKLLTEKNIISKFDIIVPIPMFKTNKRKRGYNQSELIGKELSILSVFIISGIHCTSLSENKLTIKLNHGGLSILQTHNFQSELSKLIYNQFGLKVDVELIGEALVSSESYDKMIEQASADMPDYSSQLMPEKTNEDLKHEAAEAATPTQSIDISALNLDFNHESAEIIKGKAIRTNPISISDALSSHIKTLPCLFIPS